MQKPLKWLSLIVLLFIIAPNSYAQRSGYIATDTSVVISYSLVKKKPQFNSQFVYENLNGDLKKYTPEDLTQYGFSDGTIYVSKEIEVNGSTTKVFLERINTGKLSLYYYTIGKKGTFYLEKDSTEFVKLEKNDEQYKKQIIALTDDTDWVKKQLAFIKHRRIPLDKIITKYNNNDDSRFPYNRFGITAGFSSVSLSVPENTAINLNPALEFSSANAVSIGVFADIPIDKSDFALHTGLNFVKSGISGDIDATGGTQEAIINLTTLNIPLLIRYTRPSKNWRPFINGGFNFNYNLENSARLFEIQRTENTVLINELIGEPLINDTMLGFSIGAGVLYNQGPRSIIGAELRINKHWWERNQLSKNQIDLLISYSF